MLPEKEYLSMPISILKMETIVNNLKKKWPWMVLLVISTKLKKIKKKIKIKKIQFCSFFLETEAPYPQESG